MEEYVRYVEQEVTSLAEVWIEMFLLTDPPATTRVTSLAEVWIEIHIASRHPAKPLCHFPCGSVD